MLDRKATEVRFNSEWLDMPPQELFRLMAKVTVARLLEREDFTKRMKAEEPMAGQLLGTHNLHFYGRLMAELRGALRTGDFANRYPTWREALERRDGAEKRLTAPRLPLLSSHDRGDIGLGEAELADHILVQKTRAVGRHRADRELGGMRRAELARDDDVKLGIEVARDLGGHDDPTPR